MLLSLDERDAELLSTALQTHLDDLSRELSRTERRSLQHELAQLVARLEVIALRLETLRAHHPTEKGAASDR
jgi:hypothetical protein